MHRALVSCILLLIGVGGGSVVTQHPSGAELQHPPRVQNNSSSVRCEDIQPYNGFYLPQLRGGWVALETMSVGGPSEPGAPEDASSRAGWRARLCIHSELVDVGAGHVTMLSELHLPDGEDEIEIARNRFELRGEETGRWHVVTTAPDLKGSEMLVLGTDPARYLVLALCVPEPSHPPAPSGARSPDPVRRVLANVSLLARRADRGSSGHLAAGQLAEVRGHVMDTLGIRYQPLQYDTSC